jgi:hypothetical protein
MASKPYLDEINARIAECRQAGLCTKFARYQRAHIIQMHAGRLKRERRAELARRAGEAG